jgi:hypothetical protein
MNSLRTLAVGVCALGAALALAGCGAGLGGGAATGMTGTSAIQVSGIVHDGQRRQLQHHRQVQLRHAAGDAGLHHGDGRQSRRGNQ